MFYGGYERGPVTRPLEQVSIYMYSTFVKLMFHKLKVHLPTPKEKPIEEMGNLFNTTHTTLMTD